MWQDPRLGFPPEAPSLSQLLGGAVRRAAFRIIQHPANENLILGGIGEPISQALLRQIFKIAHSP